MAGNNWVGAWRQWGQQLLYSLGISLGLLLFLILPPAVAIFLGHLLASLSLLEGVAASLTFLEETSSLLKGSHERSWQARFCLGWMSFTSFSINFATFRRMPSVSHSDGTVLQGNFQQDTFQQGFFRKHGFVWYFPLYYSIVVIPPSLVFLYTLVIPEHGQALELAAQEGGQVVATFTRGNGQAIGLAVAGVTILLAPAASMMAAGRSFLIRRKDNFEIFEKGIRTLESDQLSTRLAGVTILADLVDYDSGYAESVNTTLNEHVNRE